MARSDLLLNLVKSGATGDQAQFKRVVEAIIVEEKAKQHHALADQLVKALSVLGPDSTDLSPKLSQTISNLLHERIPKRTLADLILPEHVRQECTEVIEEHHRSALLQSYGVEPRHRIALVGPPGNGKTSLAEAIAEALMVPMLTVRYETVVSSFLGDTSNRLRALFEHVRKRACVLFFDEFDALGKERGDEHETGEIKRVVNTLLLQIDALPSHVVVVVATNHPELIDRAAWRRFQIRLELPVPTKRQLEDYFERFEKRIACNIGIAPRTIAEKLNGISFSEAENIADDVRRRQILALPDADVRRIFLDRMSCWMKRAKVGETNGRKQPTTSRSANTNSKRS